ncbi:IS200/IS605 family transposase [Aphanothece hegewaldii CCALA 016]|uniref:IS200/IS605 family transposase n=1 Tax=Aphanothece hegewaldii CCALA 016 TaxID=2107694 RepID=A0A2T1LQK7_9CHRO|nr:IS200/IS605 family transposase [Aphanothece hegewaldii]PSF26588.1 IS200/IS605 family transposase [Aphanothece hegewaldii CCALA 016]
MYYKSTSRSVSDLKAHLVLVTKYRRRVINEQILEDLISIVNNLASKWGVEIIEVNGESDHLHILFGYYPQMQLSKFVNNLKTVTSRLVNKNHAEYLKTFLGYDSVLWTSSYFIASCGGITVEKLKQYVESQNSPSET